MDFTKIVRTKVGVNKAVGKFKGLIQLHANLKENKEHLKAIMEGDCKALQEAGKLSYQRGNNDEKTAKNIAKLLFMKIFSGTTPNTSVIICYDDNDKKYSVHFSCGNEQVEIMEALDIDIGKELNDAFHEHTTSSKLVVGTRHDKPKDGKADDALIISLMNTSSKKARESINEIKKKIEEEREDVRFGFIKHEHMIYSFKRMDDGSLNVGGSMGCPGDKGKEAKGFFVDDVKPIMEEEKAAYVINNDEKAMKDNPQTMYQNEKKVVRWEINEKQFDLSRYRDKATFIKDMAIELGGDTSKQTFWKRVKKVGALLILVLCAAGAGASVPTAGLSVLFAIPFCIGGSYGAVGMGGGGKKSRRKRRKSRKKRKRTKKKRRRKRKRTKKKRRRRRR